MAQELARTTVVYQIHSYSIDKCEQAIQFESTIQQSPQWKFFIYCDTNSDKEDWYFALIRGTKLESSNTSSSIPASLSPQKYAQTLHFSTKEMINLIQALYSSEGHLQTKWMNALIGRWFWQSKIPNFLKITFLQNLVKIKQD